MPSKVSELLRRVPASARIVVGLTLAVLVPYYKLTLMKAVLVTDDVFVSDIYGGEFPVRAWAGATLRSGHLPLWIPGSAGGMPNTMIDPPSLAVFALLPPIVAMNVQLLGILLVAVLGTFALGRAMGMTRAGACLAALAYGYCGFMVCQLKHVSSVEIASTFPLGLLALERAFGPRARAPRRYASRAVWLAAFGLLVGLQVLAGFPQTALYGFLFYGVFAAARALPRACAAPRLRPSSVRLVGTLGAVTALGVGVGAVYLTLMRDVAASSDRADGISYVSILLSSYHWPSAVNFVVPYANGDVSNGTYALDGCFWEEYGYAGLLTFMLACAAVWTGRREPLVRIFAGLLVLAYLIVLGPLLPFFEFFYLHVPFVKAFRFTTRAMFVVDLALSVLAGFGLSEAQRAHSRRRRGGAVASALPWLMVVATFGDLVFHQMRQNAFGDAATFMSRPSSGEFLAVRLGGHRYFSAFHREAHVRAFRAARGWRDLEPLERVRERLQPNTNLLWGLPSADGYAGLGLQCSLDVWGDHNRNGLLQRLPFGSREFAKILALNSVSHVLSTDPLPPEAARVVRAAAIPIYEVPDALPRAYVATRAHAPEAGQDDARRLLSADFVPGRDVLIAGASPEVSPPEAADAQPGRVTFLSDGPSRVDLDVDAPAGGFLVLTDTYFAPWSAEVDGVPAEVRRANVNQRAVALGGGRHRVTFRLAWASLRRAAGVSTFSVATLLAIGLWFHGKRSTKRARAPS